MTLQINPVEVLAYLNRMGICHISTEQLQDFIKDLKRLIKSDMGHSKCSETQTSEIYSSVSDIASCNSRLSCSCGRSCGGCDKVTCVNKDRGKNGSHGECHDSCRESNCSCRKRSNSRREKHNSSRTESHRARHNSASEKHDSSEEKSQGVDRPRSCCKSSFIKPWQLQVPATSTLRRSDPVALYHKYQTMWKQQKIPGDDGRVGLRWNVREKMMGADPQPRPISSRSTSADRKPKQKPGIWYSHMC